MKPSLSITFEKEGVKVKKVILKVKCDGPVYFALANDVEPIYVCPGKIEIVKEMSKEKDYYVPNN